jgi:hypothetical protein
MKTFTTAGYKPSGSKKRHVQVHHARSEKFATRDDFKLLDAQLATVLSFGPQVEEATKNALKSGLVSELGAVKEGLAFAKTTKAQRDNIRSHATRELERLRTPPKGADAPECSETLALMQQNYWRDLPPQKKQELITSIMVGRADATVAAVAWKYPWVYGLSQQAHDSVGRQLGVVVDPNPDDLEVAQSAEAVLRELDTFEQGITQLEAMEPQQDNKRRSEMTEDEKLAFINEHGPTEWAKVPE